MLPKINAQTHGVDGGTPGINYDVHKTHSCVPGTLGEEHQHFLLYTGGMGHLLEKKGDKRYTSNYTVHYTSYSTLTFQSPL